MKRFALALILCLVLAAPALAGGKPAAPAQPTTRELQLEGRALMAELQAMQMAAQQKQARLQQIKAELERREAKGKGKE